MPTAQLTSIFPAGGRSGTSLEVEIAGSDLEGVDRLEFSHPLIKAQPQQTAANVRSLPPQQIPNRFVVSVAAEVPPGLYDVRAAGRFGVSNPGTFAVDALAELSEEATNASFDKAMRVPLESIVNGRATAGAIDYFRFTARKGQRVLIELWAERIVSPMDGTLSVLASAGHEVAHSRDAIGRDPLVDLLVPADGEYTVAVYDLVYRGGGDYCYRLALHTGPRVDFIFAPCGQPSSPMPVAVLGRNLPNASPEPAIQFDGRPLERAPATIDYPPLPPAGQLDFAGFLSSRSAAIDGFSFRWPTPSGSANSYWLTFASAPVVAEQEPNNTPAAAQQLKPPCELAGWFTGADDLDWLQFEARAGQVYWLEVLSRRRGEASDPSLLIERVSRDAGGKEQIATVAEVDDEPAASSLPGFAVASADPIYRFAPGADGTYRVLIRDLAPSISPRPYTLAIREARPDFRLVAVPIFPTAGDEVRPWSLLLRRGGTAMLDVVALRRDGFDGEIEISATGLPPGIHARDVVIGPGQAGTRLVFESAADRPASSGSIEVRGTARIGDQQITRVARGGTALWSSLPKQSLRLAAGRLTHSLPVAAMADESVPVKIELGAETAEMSRGGKLQLPVKLLRSGFDEALTLVPLGLPSLLKAENITIAKGESQGQLTIDVSAKAMLGQYSLVLRGEAKFNYRRDEVGARLAKEHKARLDKIAAELAAAVSTAAPGAARQKAEADAQAAAAAQAEAAMLAAAAESAAKPKPLKVIVYSTPARLKITAGPIELS
ncbi:MAG TPA: hypothetical protein VHY20_02480, partial [Pirellulales bacterium]|nr:hypothetical protein [Pirellulales bacterium]